MVTNREKYINNASDEDIAKVLCTALNVYNNFVNCGREDYKELYQVLSQYISSKHEEALLNHSSFNYLGEIEKWLSQEVKFLSEKDLKPLIENDKNYCLLMKEIVELQERVKELEKCSKCENICNVKIKGYSCGTVEKEKSADEMFEKLGYITHNKHLPFEYILGRSNVEIVIGDDGYSKHIFDFENNRISQTITEAEDVAIHKKISELKESKNATNM